MTFIWATRGRSWGFTFLADGGQADPLGAYERAMATLGGVAVGCARLSEEDAVALKFPDPEGRQDRSGRVIPHGFVLYGELAERVDSVEDGLREVWPLVAEGYASVWTLPKAPHPFA